MHACAKDGKTGIEILTQYFRERAIFGFRSIYGNDLELCISSLKVNSASGKNLHLKGAKNGWDEKFKNAKLKPHRY